MTDTVVSGLKTYGEIRTRIGVIIAVVVAICFCFFGWATVMNPDKHTSKTTGILSDVNCSSNTCTATALYGPVGSPSPAPYKLMANWPMGAKNDDMVDVYYNPDNPTDANPGPVSKLVGWAFIGVATLMILCSFLFMQFFSGLSNQGKAVVGGFQAAQNASSFFSKN